MDSFINPIHCSCRHTKYKHSKTLHIRQTRQAPRVHIVLSTFNVPQTMCSQTSYGNPAAGGQSTTKEEMKTALMQGET